MSKEDAHDKGQEDRSEGKDYSPPTPTGLDFGFFETEKENEENKSYREGWEHAKSQEKE